MVWELEKQLDISLLLYFPSKYQRITKTFDFVKDSFQWNRFAYQSVKVF